MKNSVVRVNQQNNVSLPDWICKVLKIKKGDQFLMDVQDGVIIMMPINQTYTKSLLGLHREIWTGSENYLHHERNAWTKSEEQR